MCQIDTVGESVNLKMAYKMLNKGDEVGRFRLGSTVILLLPKGNYEWDNSIQNEAETLMGQKLVKKSF